MEMIERVADAIFDVIWPTQEWNMDESLCRAVADGAARSAIEAMREPTEAMVDSCGNGDAAKWGRGCWANYIDAALAIRASPVEEM